MEKEKKIAIEKETLEVEERIAIEKIILFQERVKERLLQKKKEEDYCMEKKMI